MNTVSKNKVVLLFGPTGVGKTDLLDRFFAERGEVISADSMQVYRGMDIGTAKPDAALQRRLPHHLIDIRNPDQQFHAGDFLRLAEAAAVEISRRGKLPVLSGGTAFYFRNFLYGLPETPPGDERIRKELEEEKESRGLASLYDELKNADPVSAERIAPRDAYRILRALEVFRLTGRPLSSFQVPLVPRRDFSCLTIGLDRPREELYTRIDRRVEIMFEAGLEEEARTLMRSGYRETDPGMQAIGYREFFQAGRSGCSTRGSIVEAIQKNSRRYAKRQITFFRSFSDVHWVHPDDLDQMEKLLQNFLKDTSFLK